MKTVPDSVLELANEIEIVDLTPEGLREAAGRG